MNKETWSRSIREEVVAVLWLIAALLAWLGGIKWLAYLLFVKALMDTACAIVFAVIDGSRELKEKRNANTNN